MTTELQAMLQRWMDAADEDDGKKQYYENGQPLGAPVLTGDASMIQNAQDLAREIELKAESGWDARVEVPDATIWRADHGVTPGQQFQWVPWANPLSVGGAVTAGDEPPTLEAHVFGRGAREFANIANVESFAMRYQRDVSQELLMGSGKTHTIVFWVYPDIEYLQTATEDMTICGVWGAANHNHYWLGITPDGEFVYKVSQYGTDVSASVTASITVGETPAWYRVAARYDGTSAAIGVAPVGDDMAWECSEYGGGIYGGLSDPGWHGSSFYVGGSGSGLKFKGQMTHGYYYGVALTDEQVDQLAGEDVHSPVSYDEIMSGTSWEGDLRDELVSCWPLNEPSGAYAYDKAGRNNLHWGFWWEGSMPGPAVDGFPGVLFVRSSDPGHLQYLRCDGLAAALCDATSGPDPNYPHRRMTVIALVKPQSRLVSGQYDTIVAMSGGQNNLAYRMWDTVRAFHRDSRGNPYWGSATLYGAPSRPIEHTNAQLGYGSIDQSAHVLCTVWGPVDAYDYGVTLYVDDPIEPFEEPVDLTGHSEGSPPTFYEVDPISFSRFSIGAVARYSDVLYPFNGYLGILVVVPRAVSDEERLFLMQWVKATAGLI